MINEECPSDGSFACQTQIKVVMVVGEFPPLFGGISDYTAFLAKEFVKLGIRVVVVTTKVNSFARESFDEGVDVRRIMSKWRMREVRFILNIIDEMGPGTIVNLQYGGYATQRRPMVTLLPAILRLLRPHCRVVVTLHEFRGQRLRWRMWTVPMPLAAHGLIFVDPPDRKLLARWTTLRRPRIKCIPIAPTIPPVPVTSAQRRTWRQNLGVVDDRPIVVFFGSIEPGKGFFDLLKSVKNLREADLPLCLLVIGRFEPWYRWKSHYESEVLMGGVETGWVKLVEKSSPSVVSQYLHASDVAVFPFIRGARSNRSSLLTAIAHGLPVVTTRGVDTPDGFDEQFGVALVPAQNVLALSTCLKGVLMSEELKEQMKVRALKAAMAFSWPSIARTSAGFYASLTVALTHAI